MDTILEVVSSPPAARAAGMHLLEAAEHLGRWYWLRLTAAELVRVRSGLRMEHIEDEAEMLLGLPAAHLKTMTPAAVASRARAEIENSENLAWQAMALVRTRLAKLAARVGLDTASIDLLVFAVTASRDSAVGALCSQLTAFSIEDAAKLLASVIDADPQSIADALKDSGALAANGLLSPRSEPSELDDFVRTNKSVSAGLFAACDFEAHLLNRTFVIAEGSQRDAKDYAHLAVPIALIKAVLARMQGPAHVLLSGAPGVGKTQLARRVARELEWTAYEVRTDEGCGDPSLRDHRFRHYSLDCKLMAEHECALIIFDEAEDVFVGDHWTHVASNEVRHKGWTNLLLETARVPTIWISNSLERIDPAYLRRFDYVLEMRTPPRSVRRCLVEEATRGSGVSPSLVERIAESEDFTPADADRIARVLPRAIAQGLDADSALRELASCRPDGVRRAQLAEPRSTGLPFRLDWINVDADLPQLVAGLRKRGAGSLGFFGPPGTGKTELAKHLARELDRPLMLKKASDLIDPFIGMTERRIAEAFESATRDEAVLLIDEADSFLRERIGANHSWEITQVNELLAQLDTFGGIVVVVTNHVETLDRAVMRRLDAKLTFGSLRPVHIWQAFCAALDAMGLACCEDGSTLIDQVRGLSGATFGDISCAVRNQQLNTKEPDAKRLYGAVLEEVMRKNGGYRAIGFCVPIKPPLHSFDAQ